MAQALKIAVAIERLSRPLGGLQRDCLRLIEILRAKGHQVDAFAARADKDWANPVSVFRRQNHRRLADLGRYTKALSTRYNLIIGFNPIPGLDVLYCGDASYVARSHNILKRLTPRFRTLRQLEGACFLPDSATQVWLLSSEQRSLFLKTWNSEAEHLHIVPESLPQNRVHPKLRADPHRANLRRSLSLSPANIVWVHIGVYPKTKGLRRAIDALSNFPDARLVVVGPSNDDASTREFIEQSKRLGCHERVNFLGYRENIPELMAAADLLVHPATLDITGTVILEAIYNGLPIVASSNCGFARLVSSAEAGRVLRDVDDPDELHNAITSATPEKLQSWSKNAISYAARHEITDKFQGMAETMLSFARI